MGHFLKRVAAIPLALAAALIPWMPFSAWALKSGSGGQWPFSVERGSYQAKIASSGRILWSVDWETQVTSQDGGAQVEIAETGRGQPLKYKEPIAWEKKMFFSAPERAPLRVHSIEDKRWTQKGKWLSSMAVRADPGRGRIEYTQSTEGRPTETSELAWSSSALPDEMLFHWARTIPFEEAASADFLLLISPRQQVSMEARVRGTETVSTPAGTFTCWRVDLVPQLFGPLKMLAPGMSLWCKRDSPHAWVRYQGPVGGPGSPQAVIELVRFEQTEKR